ncbi:MAG TPA: hypothetical protein VGJ03_04915 [Acidimicrobiales bacterium]|jgi:hypothetical protein
MTPYGVRVAPGGAFLRVVPVRNVPDQSVLAGVDRGPAYRILVLLDDPFGGVFETNGSRQKCFVVADLEPLTSRSSSLCASSLAWIARPSRFCVFWMMNTVQKVTIVRC